MEFTINQKVSHDVQIIWELTKDYKEVKAYRFFWTLIHCAVLGWGCFFMAAYQTGPTFFILYIAALIFIYKGTLMIHEVAHFQKKVKGLRFVYNLLFGFPNKYPAYLYDTHPFHHGRNTFSTYKDPEYQYVPKDNFKTIIAPLVSALILPIFQVIRFGVIPIIYMFFGEKFRKYIYTHYSTLIFDLKYKRIAKDKGDLFQMMRNDIMCSVITISIGLLIYKGLLPFKLIPLWYGMVFTASILNMYRAKFNHVYNNKQRSPQSWESHLLDCITVEGGLTTELWSPVGLRYHALHHVMQEIPFHNIKAAHHLLMKKLPSEHIYKKTVVKNFIGAIRHRNKLSI